MWTVVVASALPSALAAQATAAPVVTSPLSLDSLPPFERPNGALLRGGSLMYVLTLIRQNGDLIPLGTRTVSVSEVSAGGTPSWLIAEGRYGTVVETTDSVTVTRADLAPVHWSATIGTSRFAASFTRDSMFGGIDTYQGRASFGVATPSNALLSAGMVERIIEMLSLREGYKASAALLVVEGQTPRVLAAAIVVDAIETVTVGSQSVECWRVMLRTATTEERLWVARDGARVVRSEQLLPSGVLRAELRP
jgi:hypothetical protein